MFKELLRLIRPEIVVIDDKIRNKRDKAAAVSELHQKLMSKPNMTYDQAIVFDMHEYVHEDASIPAANGASDAIVYENRGCFFIAHYLPGNKDPVNRLNVATAPGNKKYKGWIDDKMSEGDVEYAREALHDIRNNNRSHTEIP